MSGRPPLAALGLAVALSGCSGPGPVAVSPPVQGAAAACGRLHAALPATVGDLKSRSTSPRSDRSAAWGDPPIVLRCGVARPASLGNPDVSPLRVDEQVQWLRHIGGTTVDWTVIDRAVFIEVAIPKRYAAASVLPNLTRAVTTLPQQDNLSAAPTRGASPSSAAAPPGPGS